jgi:DNA-binding SARP family transcriptional activator
LTPPPGRSGRRAKEILGYLALNRRGPVSREALTEVIFHDCPTDKSRKGMRQALWQLRTDLSPKSSSACADRILGVEPGWVQFMPDDRVWLDVADFERMTARRTSRQSTRLEFRDATLLVQAIELYRGDLLEGWFQEWCLEERERLRQELGIGPDEDTRALEAEVRQGRRPRG